MLLFILVSLKKCTVVLPEATEMPVCLAIFEHRNGEGPPSEPSTGTSRNQCSWILWK